ncbi:MAG: hypothetical protein GEU75_15340 [Dehalococcoidia bacterium]|nr:hypothetical protein [Dehalococcoidia bacterium]
MDTIDLTPTPDGIRHSIRLFEEEITRSEHLIRVADEWEELVDMEREVHVTPDEFCIFLRALEALREQERQRIEHMREGIAGARGEV